MDEACYRKIKQYRLKDRFFLALAMKIHARKCWKVAFVFFLPSLLSLSFWPLPLRSAVEFYNKSEIQKRMMNREIISVVNTVSDPVQQNLKTLAIKAGGMLQGVSLEQATQFMTNYESLEEIAPKYIKVSSLKKTNSDEKYIHIKSELKTTFVEYHVESLMKVREEKLPDRSVIHFEVVPGKTLGLKIDQEKFVGFKGSMTVQKIRPMITSLKTTRGFIRKKDKDYALLAVFQGEVATDDISKILPNFMLKFAMEVALQKVGILFRNYIEKHLTEKEKS